MRERDLFKEAYKAGYMKALNESVNEKGNIDQFLKRRTMENVLFVLAEKVGRPSNDMNENLSTVAHNVSSALFRNIEKAIEEAKNYTIDDVINGEIEFKGDDEDLLDVVDEVFDDKVKDELAISVFNEIAQNISADKI